MNALLSDLSQGETAELRTDSWRMTFLGAAHDWTQLTEAVSLSQSQGLCSGTDQANDSHCLLNGKKMEWSQVNYYQVICNETFHKACSPGLI